MSYASYFDSPVAILSLDQEMAFDRVDWNFMLSTLSNMGFGPSFISWVRLFYTGVQSAVSVNGYLSSFFYLSRGVRQGCPLSPPLYVQVSEMLAVNIRSNPRIKGLSLPNVPRPLSRAWRFTIFYERGSGSKFNMSKSRGLWLGSWSGRSDPPVALEWSSVKIKVLGVFIGPGNLENVNWRPRITAVQNCLLSWKHRILFFRGRALIINALSLSRVWYVASLVHMAPWVLNELKKIAFAFFWKGKKDLVSRAVVV